MTNPSIILVFGISGVGKTTFCRQYVDGNSSYAHIQVSRLLQEIKSKSSEDLRRGSGEEILQNQFLMQERVFQERIENIGRALLVDAHSVIDGDRAFVEVPVDAIRMFAATHITVIEDDPAEIYDRRLRDARIRPHRTIEQLKHYQELSSSRARLFSRVLQIPILVRTVKSSADFTNLIAEVQRINFETLDR